MESLSLYREWGDVPGTFPTHRNCQLGLRRMGIHKKRIQIIFMKKKVVDMLVLVCSFPASNGETG